jgi:integrase
MGIELEQTGQEGLLIGVKSDGMKYSVRQHRLTWLMPDTWIKFVDALRSPKAKLTADVLIQTGARINEVRHIEERDIDYQRNTLRLRITKTKAKKGERTGKPRTIPISSQFAKRLKKHFAEKEPGSRIGILSTPAFNIALKKALIKIGYTEPYMVSTHNIRKTHGNWLKIMGNLNVMAVDASEICLRLGHDYNTFLSNYGSSSIMDNKDVLIVKQILGDLYSR